MNGRATPRGRTQPDLSRPEPLALLLRRTRTRVPRSGDACPAELSVGGSEPSTSASAWASQKSELPIVFLRLAAEGLARGLGDPSSVASSEESDSSL